MNLFSLTPSTGHLLSWMFFDDKLLVKKTLSIVSV